MSEMIKIPDGWNKSDLGSIIELLTDYTANGSFESLRDNVQYYNSEEYAVLVRTTDLNKRILADYKRRGWITRIDPEDGMLRVNGRKILPL